MQKGDKGEGVSALQRDLAKWGFHPGSDYGTFDEKTEEAVRAVQTKLGLPTTGIVDERFAAAVDSDLTKEASVLNAQTMARQESIDSAKNKLVLYRPQPVQPPKQQLSGLASALGSPIIWIVLGAAGVWLVTRNRPMLEVDSYEEEDDEDEKKFEESIEELKEEVQKQKKPRKQREKKKVVVTGVVRDGTVIDIQPEKIEVKDV